MISSTSFGEVVVEGRVLAPVHDDDFHSPGGADREDQLGTEAEQPILVGDHQAPDLAAFADRIGTYTQGFITATDAIDNSTARGTAAFSLTGGIHDGSFRAEQDSYAADGSTETSTTLFRAGGARSVDVLAAGQTFSSDHSDVWNNGGAPETTFVFDSDYGHDAIRLFRVSGADHDALSFKGSDFGPDPASQLAGVLASTHFEKGGAVITDPATQETVKLFGVSRQQLVANQ